LHENISSEFVKFIKAADIIASLIKCKAEINAGNSEFKQAVQDTGERLTQMAMPEVDYFLENFLPSFDLTLDELITPSETMFPDNK
jgi:5'-deoxynucleotidase